MSDEPQKEEKKEDSATPNASQESKKPENKTETTEKPEVKPQKEEKKDHKKEETQSSQSQKQAPALKSGQKIKVHQKIKEGKKERIQIFEGIIIATKGQTPETKTITVRKSSGGIDVEKIFPLAMPSIEKIEVVSKLNTRKSKLYYLREYKKKIKEDKV